MSARARHVLTFSRLHLHYFAVVLCMHAHEMSFSITSLANCYPGAAY